MSVRWTRTAVISKSRFMEAISWGKETAAYAEKKYGTKIEVWVDAFGPVGTIRWSADFADLASVEKVQAQMMMDADYWKMIDKAGKADLFIDGSATDTVSRSV